jgi:hypothetical protein
VLGKYEFDENWSSFALDNSSAALARWHVYSSMYWEENANGVYITITWFQLHWLYILEISEGTVYAIRIWYIFPLRQTIADSFATVHPARLSKIRTGTIKLQRNSRLFHTSRTQCRSRPGNLRTIWSRDLTLSVQVSRWRNTARFSWSLHGLNICSVNTDSNACNLSENFCKSMPHLWWTIWMETWLLSGLV